jgi:PucR C-terminal helix-turn-helix domain
LRHFITYRASLAKIGPPAFSGGGGRVDVSGLFDQLKATVDLNAQRAVDLYARELADYRSMAIDERTRSGLLDFAVLLRRRTAELAADDRPFADDDLGVLSSMGRERGEHGVSLASQRKVLVLHSTLTLREVQEAAGPKDIDDLMRMLGWLAREGTIAGHAFTCGFFEGQRRFLPAVTRIQLLADMLLAADDAASELARSIGMTLSDGYVVTVVRIAGEPFRSWSGPREEIIEILVKGHQVPMTWHRPEEFVALVPSGDAGPSAPAQDRALALARDFAELIARPCAVGAAPAATTSALPEAVTLARQVSRAAPVEVVPSRAHTMADVFVELGTAGLPQVDGWLHDVARRLREGPDLVATLDAYYRSDMNRLVTAAMLHVHPRTLDYRLQRARRLTGIEPASTRGVRVLSTAVTRMLAGAWPDDDLSH